MFTKYLILVLLAALCVTNGLFFYALNNLSLAYVFECLDKCECETDDQVMHCHDNPTRQQFQTPKIRLAGFTVLRLTNNNLTSLPSEELLLEKFPHLKAVDVAANPAFNCETLEHYQKVTILSDCDKDPNEIRNSTIIYTDIIKNDNDCDYKCQMDKHYEQMHKYFLQVWEELKKKLDKLARDNKIIGDIKEFLMDISKRIQAKFED